MSLKLEKLSILIVEDTEPLRRLMGSVLEALGVGKVYYARDGEEGFQIFCRTAPDIVIVDWHMPDLDGMALAELIRKSPHSADKMVPIIMMTGYSSQEKIALARDTGITEFLVKPFTAEDFIKRIFYVIQFPRDFIDCPTYFGPDRRRHNAKEYGGPFRRLDDKKLIQKVDKG